MLCVKYPLIVAVILLVTGQVCLSVEKKQIMLSECGKTKGCYRNPQGCKNEETCQNILTWKVKNNAVDFEVSAMLGTDEMWTAVGFSYDKMMGNDSVADCIYDDKNQSLIIQSSYNNNDPANEVLAHNELGIVKGKSSGLYRNQRIMCTFSRYITVRNDTEANKVFDLNATYYILLAKGKVADGVKQPHTTPPVVVPVMINTTSRKYQDLNNLDVAGCGKTKGCYRSPSNCSGEQDCAHLLIWEVKNDSVSFKMSSLLPNDRKWTAVGFSYDQKMGNDSVVDCIYNETDHTIVIQTSYNNDDPNNVVLKNNQLGLVAGSSTGAYVNGRIACTFSHYIAPSATDPEKNEVFNLNSSFYLFLARGPAMNGVKQKHTDAPAVSPQTVNVCDKNYPDITGESLMSALVKAHGSMMIIAWMFISSVAIIIPKYYKTVGPQDGVCGMALWLQSHRLLMLVAFLLTAIAFIIIFVEVGGYAHHLSGVDSIHPVVGIIVTSLTVLNPVIGLLRPSTDSPNRPLFYAAHKTMGVFAFLLAAAAMFLGTRLEKANMPYFSQWVVVGFAVWHLAVNRLLGVHQKGYQKTQLVISEPEHVREETEDTKPLNGNSGLIGMKTALAGRSAVVFKTVVILIHLCVLLGCSTILIVNLAEN